MCDAAPRADRSPAATSASSRATRTNGDGNRAARRRAAATLATAFTCHAHARAWALRPNSGTRNANRERGLGGDAGLLAEETGNALHHTILLIGGNLRKHRQRQHVLGRTLARREVALAIAEVVQAFLHV